MALQTNSLEGGSNGTTITTGNSGGVSGAAFAAVAGSPTFSNAQAAHGSLSANMGNTAAAALVRYSVASNHVAVRSYFWLGGLSAADERLVIFQDSSGASSYAYIVANGAGKLRFGCTGGSSMWTAAATYPTSQWLRLEMYCVAGSTTSNGVAKVGIYVGDSTTPIETVYTSSALNIGGGGATFGRVVVGTYSGTLAQQVYVDDIAVEDSASDLIGPVTASPTSPAYPTAVDSNAGSWTNTGGAASIQAALADASDSTYILSPGSGSDEAIVLSVGPLLSGSNVRVPYRAWLPAGSTATQVKVELMEGGTVRASQTQTLTSSVAPYTLALTSGEVSSITDRTNLKLRITGNPS